ncbi:MAG: hypothetical protein ACI835_001989 [Planctomycetota bacterium]|jgi:hypothetical protein
MEFDALEAGLNSPIRAMKRTPRSGTVSRWPSADSDLRVATEGAVWQSLD